jgi:hypothetical protein
MLEVRGSFKKFPDLLYFWAILKEYNYLSYVSFKIAPLGNYTLVSATVKALETFLESIL